MEAKKKKKTHKKKQQLLSVVCDAWLVCVFVVRVRIKGGQWGSQGRRGIYSSVRRASNSAHDPEAKALSIKWVLNWKRFFSFSFRSQKKTLNLCQHKLLIVGCERFFFHLWQIISTDLEKGYIFLHFSCGCISRVSQCSDLSLLISSECFFFLLLSALTQAARH